MTDNEAINMVDKAIKSEFFEKCKIGYDLAEALGIVVGVAKNAIKNSEALAFKEEIIRMVNMGVYPEAIVEWVREREVKNED